MLFDYLVEVNERYKEKIHEEGYRLVFVIEYLMRSSFLSSSKVDENFIEIEYIKEMNFRRNIIKRVIYYKIEFLISLSDLYSIFDMRYIEYIYLNRFILECEFN